MTGANLLGFAIFDWEFEGPLWGGLLGFSVDFKSRSAPCGPILLPDGPWLGDPK